VHRFTSEGAAEGAASIAPNAKVTQNRNGTYEEQVQVSSEGNKQWVDKPLESTFFPADWSRARIEFEVSEAFKLKHITGAEKWQGTSPAALLLRDTQTRAAQISIR
jgi:hypothetical protein